MDGKKGILVGILATGVVVFILFMVLTLGSQTSNNIELNTIDFNEKFLRHQSDMHDTEASITLDKKGKERALAKSKEEMLEVEAIQKQKKEALQRKRELEEKERKGFDAIEKEFDKRNQEDSFFTIKADDEEF